MTNSAQKQNGVALRPPIIVVLGHVDHGKTTILDYIRQTKITNKEAGGITQHIGAYQIKHQEKPITFIDTPGHEAFSAMRSRGAKVADLAILVVAADEGVKPQTKEAIEHIKKANLPMIVAINKIDKSTAQSDKVKNELMKEKIVVESLGGQVPGVELSAQTGQGIDDLLEMCLLMAEMEISEKMSETLKKPTNGVVIESLLDSRRGPTATLLVKEGALKLKDIVVTDSSYGPIKSMEDFRGQALKKAEASMPILATGFNQAPRVGEPWHLAPNLEKARQETEQKSILEQKKRKFSSVIETESEKPVLNIIIKADVIGSLEAVEESLGAIPQEEVILRILKAEPGEINESDIKLAQSAKARIFGFRVKSSSALTNLARRLEIKIALFDIIYEFIQGVREALVKLLPDEIIRRDLGQVKILATFKSKNKQQIVGGKVISGKVIKNSLIEVIRNEEKIGSGRLVQLQQNKVEADEVAKGKECGLAFIGGIKIEIGDILNIYQEEKKKRTI